MVGREKFKWSANMIGIMVRFVKVKTIILYHLRIDFLVLKDESIYGIFILDWIFR